MRVGCEVQLPEQNREGASLRVGVPLVDIHLMAHVEWKKYVARRQEMELLKCWRFTVVHEAPDVVGLSIVCC